MSERGEVAVEAFMDEVVARDPHEPEFHQAVREVVAAVAPSVADRADWRDARILERIVEPERVVSFRVVWEDDAGAYHVERGYRVQFNGALGPYKGGLRFHPTVDLSILKFLGFEQIFKNALTGLPLGAGKGGATFDPKGRSDHEIRRFCQAYMTELHRHIGPDTDVPAGDIGVGAREIGFLFGQYRRIANRWSGVLTGKGIDYGGSLVRTEATGYGAVYFTDEVLSHANDGLADKMCAVSGSGNVALYCIEKLLERGARVVTVSDSSGFVHDPDGIDAEKLAWIRRLKEERRGRIREYAEAFGLDHHDGARPWGVPCDWAFPCATQNEIGADDARSLVDHGCRGVTEGANMPVDAEAMEVLRHGGVIVAPGKAANAGGVAVSALEMSQNAMRTSWSALEVDERLRQIVHRIHRACVRYGEQEDGAVDYVRGANLAAFRRVADAMVAQGAI